MDAHLVRILPSEARELFKSAYTVRQLIKNVEHESNRFLSLQEAWAGLHFLISGELPLPQYEANKKGVSWSKTSLENIIMGGVPTAYMTTFGPACYLEPEIVSLMADKLSGISTDDFRARFDADDLLSEGIPPMIWDEDQSLAWLTEHFVNLARFYQNAALTGDGLLIYII